MLPGGPSNPNDPRDSVNNPLAQIPGMTYVSPMMPERRPIIMPMLLGLLGFVVVGGFGLLVYTMTRTPVATETAADKASTIFSAAITKALSTGIVQSKLVYTGMEITAVQDASTLNNPRISTLVNRVTSGGGTARAVSYGSLKNSYIKFDQGSTYYVPADALGKWMAVRKDGAIPPKLTGSVGEVVFPEYLMMGPYIFGNFSEAQRTTLTNYLRDNEVFVFDSTKVTEGTLGTRNVMVYDVTYNTDNLIAYNKLVGGMYGMSEKDLVHIGVGIKYYGVHKVYIDTDLKQIFQVEYDLGPNKAVKSFDKFNDAALLAEPVAVKSYSQYTKAPTLW